MNDGGSDYNAKRRSTGGMLNDMRILLPSQVLINISYSSIVRDGYQLMVFWSPII